ncbi:hypothetical protein KEM54_005425 [Ascosphaera aggregata]|nr:hypothetical protein KEM54_005425 [Ascosphaera aggregata]
MRLSIAKKSTLGALSFIGVASASLSAENTNATVTTDNLSQVGTTYTAVLLQKWSTQVRGTMTVTPGPGGVGVSVTLMLTGLTGPDEDAYATGGVLDPLNAGVSPDCKIANPSACRVGDLTGKHGPLLPYNYLCVYNDKYLSLDTEDPAFLGNRSIVISASDGTPVNCANFTLLGEVIDHPLPLNPPPMGKPIETFPEPSFPEQLASTLAAETVEKVVTRSSLQMALSTPLVPDATTTHPAMATSHTTVVTGDTSTGLAIGRTSPCASQQPIATGLMTGVVTAAPGIVRPTASSQSPLCTPAAAPAAYHSPTVSSPASDARSIQLGRSSFRAIASIVGAILVALL